MADNTIQFGITVDASAVSSGLADVRSAFQSTTSAVASQWTETSSTVALSLKKIADEAEATSGRTKEQIEKAAGAVDLLGDMIGVKVPDQLRKMLASSSLVGPALESAFSGIAIIAVGKLIFEVGQKIVTFISSLGDLSDAEKTYHDQVIKHANEELHFIQAQIKAAYAVQIAKASGNELAQQTLRVQMYTGLVGASNQYVQKLEQEQQRLLDLAKTAHQTSDDFVKTGSDASGLVIFFSERKVEAYQKEAAAQQRVIDEAKIAVQEATADQIAANAQLGAEQKRERDEQQRRAQAAFRRAEEDFRQHLQTQLVDLKQDHQVSLTEELYFWKARLAAAKQYPDVYRQIIKRIADIEQGLLRERQSSQETYFRDAAAQAVRSSNENLEIVKQASQAIIKDAKDRLDAQAELYKGDIENAKIDEQTKVQLAEAALARGRITKQQEIAIVADAKRKEVAEEIKAWQAIEFIYDSEPKKVAEIEAKVAALKRQYRLIDATAAKQAAQVEESQLQKRLQDWQNVTKQMQDSYLQMLDQMNSALASFVATGQFNWRQMATSMIEDIVRIALQWIESQILMKVFGINTSKETAGSNILDSAASGAAAAGASVAAIPVIGWGMVEAVSASTYGILAAYEDGVAASAEGGQWEVPGLQMTMLHPQEMVLPASLAGRMRDVIDGGGTNGGGRVQIHFHVNAIDGQDAANFIGKNSRNIAGAVIKELKKKGVFSK